MKAGVALPSLIPETYGAHLLDWAVAAEQLGFDSAAVLNGSLRRGFDPVVTLAAVGAATRRPRLIGGVLAEQPGTSMAEFGRQLGCVDEISGTRLTVALAPRGARALAELDRATGALRDAWASSSLYVASDRPDGPDLLLRGDMSGLAGLVARRATGWMGGGVSLDTYRRTAEQLDTAWASEARDGRPYIVGVRLFSFGSDADETADRHISHRYGTAESAREYRHAVLTHPDQVPDALAAMDDAGVDELVFAPCSTAISHLELLASAVLPRTRAMAVSA